MTSSSEKFIDGVVDAQEELDKANHQLIELYYTIADGEELHVLTVLVTTFPHLLAADGTLRFHDDGMHQLMHMPVRTRRHTLLIALNVRDLGYLKPMGVIRSFPEYDVEWRERIVTKDYSKAFNSRLESILFPDTCWMDIKVDLISIETLG